MNSDVTAELKKLNLELQTDMDRYINGELDILPKLEKTQELFQRTTCCEKDQTANKVLPDSQLLQLQTKIVSQSTRIYKPDTLVFNPSEFAVKLTEYVCQGATSSTQSSSYLWLKIGEEARNLICSVPTFDFIYGTFDPDSVELIKRKRKIKDKEKDGDVTKPQSMSINESAHERDTVMNEAERLYSILRRFWEKSGNGLICYFEFVTDPSSFSRTIENIFILSLIIKEGHVRIIADENGQPYLKAVSEEERRERNPAAMKQTIISLTMDEWQEIIKKLKLDKALIPPRKRK